MTKGVNNMECCKRKIRSEEEKKNLTIRINKIVGQMNGIKKMIEDDRYCDDILIQLSAIDKSIKSLANIILDNHMHSCLIEDIKNDNYEIIDEIVQLFKRFQ
ncbi:MAG: metal-sensing transcriptional repressor [Anaeroplasmataceae bacterium]